MLKNWKRFNHIGIDTIFIIVLILILFGFAENSYGADYYVRTDGSNQNDGYADDPAHAWQTVTYAESKLTNGTHTVHIAEGVYPETVTIDVSGTGPDNRITFIGYGDVYVERIYLGNTNNTGEADYVTLSNLVVGISSSPSNYSIIRVNRNSDYAIIIYCTIDAHNYTGLEGVSLYGNYGLITECTVQNIDNTYAVSVGEGDRRDGVSTNGVAATHNIIQNNKDSDSFRVHGINHTISFNEVRNIEKDDSVDRNHPDFVQWFTNDNDCANSYDVRNILIEGNYVHDAEIQVWYGNNVCEAYGSVTDNIIFRNNVFHKVGMMSQDHGETVTNIKVYNNIFHTIGYLYYSFGTQRTYSTHAISFSSHSSGVEVRNNVFLNCGDEPDAATKGWYATNNPSGFSASNNYVGGPLYAAKNTNTIYSTYWAETTPPSINGGDPKFVDEANHDYRLATGSPLINAGIEISSFSTDRAGIIRPQGTGWDIGAYEYVDPNFINHQKNLPSDVSLYQNYPNPFNPETVIHFTIPEMMGVELKIYDLLGREVTTVANEIRSAGQHSLKWNGKNSTGQQVSTGIYYCQLRTSTGWMSTMKMLKLK